MLMFRKSADHAQPTHLQMEELQLMTCTEAVAQLHARPTPMLEDRVLAAFGMPWRPLLPQMIAVLSLRKLMDSGETAQVLQHATRHCLPPGSHALHRTRHLSDMHSVAMGSCWRASLRAPRVAQHLASSMTWTPGAGA